MDGKAGAGRWLLALDRALDHVVMAEPGADGTPGTPVQVPVGKGPCALALGADGGRAYAAGYDEGTLSVLVPGGSATTVQLSGALCAVAAGLFAEQVCVASWTDDVVHVLDKDGNGGRTVQVGGGPFALAGAPGGRWVCVAHDKDEGAARRLDVVDVGTPGSPRTTPVAMAAPVRAVAVSPDGRFGYALCAGTGVVVVDLSRATVTTSHAVGPGPATVVVGHDRLWIADQESAELWVAALDAGTGEPGAFTALPVARRPSAVLLSPDGTAAHVLSRTTGVLSACFPTMPAARTDVPVGVLPPGLATDPDGLFVYVTDQATGKVLTLRVGPAVTGTIGTGDVTKPFATGVTPDGRWACTTDASGNRVALADLDAGTHRDTIALPSGTTAWGIAMGPALSCVTSPGTDQLLTLRLAGSRDFSGTPTVTVEATALAKGAQPHGVAVSPDGRYAVTADSGAGTASRVDLRGGSYTLRKDVVKCEIPLGLAIRNDTLYVADYVSQEMDVPKGRISVLRRAPSGWAFDHAIDKDQGHFTGPHEIALSAKGDHLYVTNYDSRGGRPTKVSVLRWNGSAWEFGQGIERDDLTNPHGLALSGEDPQKKAKLYVSSAGTGKVAQFTVTDSSHVKFDCWLTIEPSNDLPASLALSPDGAYLYATHFAKGLVYGITVPRSSDAAMTAVGDLTVNGVRGIACRGTDTLYVVNEKRSGAAGLTTVTLDDTRLRAASVSEPQPLTDHPWTIVAGDDDTLYIADYTLQEVAVRGSGVTPIPVTSSDDSRPWEVACTPDGGHAYVTDRSLKAPSVHWVSLTTAQKTATLPVGTDPVGVACAPDGLRAYVACAGDRSVSVLRRRPELTADSLTTADPAVPLSLAVHPTAPYAYRVHHDALCPVSLVGTGEGQHLAVPGRLCDVAVHPDGAFAYLPGTGNQGEPVLHVVGLENPATPTTGNAVALPGTQTPTALALHPSGIHGYVTGVLNGAVTLWALALATPAEPTAAGAFPLSLPSVRSMAVAPAHLYALTAEGAGDAALHVLELSATSAPPDAPVERPRAKLSLPGRPRSIRVHPLGGHAFVSTDDKGVHLLDLTDPARPQLVGTVPADAGAAAFRPDGPGAFLAQKDRIRGLGLGTPDVLPGPWVLPGSCAPRRLLVSADGRSVYVTGENSGDLHVLDAASGTVRHTVGTGTALAGLALRPGTAGRRLYVVDEGAPAALVMADMAEHAPVGTALEAGIDLRQVHIVKGTSS
ncbi:hypothetical protein [Streptomyces cinnamoneus]|uniref:YncE family protein n=1 Tax=Streptomyces cinnamoneus TaxID=53446 RepID=A0A918WFM3_STRCJ|nr:hypothetical protein [Streptomyces cinnamoneus]GHC39351.1 hypothetical protein GCM10010507_11390 [Streptomyces cinnamoneus]